MDDGVHSCMRFIDFKSANIEQQRRGEANTWQDGDEAELLSSEYLFARKMSSKNQVLINSLVKALLGTTEKWCSGSFAVLRESTGQL